MFLRLRPPFVDAFFGMAFYALLAPLSATLSHAQNLPNAGSLQQQISRDRETVAPKEIQATDLPKVEAQKRSGGPKITVKAFKFVGNHLLDDVILKAETESFRGRLIDFSELEAAASAVAEFYRSKGFIARSTLPPQDIKEGVVTIEIVESIFGKAIVEPYTGKRVDVDRILKTIYAVQKSGEPLKLFDVDRALAQLADLSGVQIQGSLMEGDGPGQTNLLVTLKDASAVSLDASSDNTGSRSTGPNRLLANLGINSPMGLGDQFSINTMASSGTQYLRLSESMPLGYSGSKLGLNMSHMKYQLVTQDYAALMAKGTADSVGLETSYPLIMSRQSSLSVLLGLEGKHLVNQSQGTTASDYVSRLMNLSFSGSSLASSMSQTRSSYRLDLIGGQLDLSKSANQSADANTTKTAGPFNKVKYFFSRDQDIGRGFSFYTSVNGQWANKNLDSSEKFYLGGIYGVRAYPSNEAGGALGQLANLEIRSRWGQFHTLSAFYDYGRVLINPLNDYSGALALNRYALRGYGFSYAYSTSDGATIKATLARRIGNNPNPTTVGNDQDGSMVKNRLWLNASLPF